MQKQQKTLPVRLVIESVEIKVSGIVDWRVIYGDHLLKQKMKIDEEEEGDKSRDRLECVRDDIKVNSMTVDIVLKRCCAK